MILTPQNSTNPAFWGKDLKIVINGQTYEPNQEVVDIPNEIDFIKEIYGNFAPNAKDYFKKTL